MQSAYYVEETFPYRTQDSLIPMIKKSLWVPQMKSVSHLSQSIDIFVFGWTRNVRVLRVFRFTFSTCSTRSLSQNRCSQSVNHKRLKRFVWNWTNIYNPFNPKLPTSFKRLRTFSTNAKDWIIRFRRKGKINQKAKNNFLNKAKRGWKSLWLIFWGNKWEDRSKRSS